MHVLPTFKAENRLWKDGHHYVAGFDEVGRGPLAGPIVVGAVIFKKNHKKIDGIQDSKKIPKKTLKILATLIQSNAVCTAIGIGGVEIINSHGIITAWQEAVRQAYSQLVNCNFCLIDGLKPKTDLSFLPSHNFIVKGDQSSYSIAAASIIAKVYRDELMTRLGEQYPEYGWHTNAGYATQQHQSAIRKLGLTSFHRTQFCSSLV